jgi:uncharacterized damage-inducible protein DinB
MKQIKAEQWLETLQADVRRIILAASKLSIADPEMLMIQPAPGKWSVAQVLEHLNSYGRYYLPELKKALQQNKPAVPYFKSGWLGSYFTKLMQPKEGVVVNKMKSPKDHRPVNDLDIKPVMDHFIQQQQELLDLLEAAKEKNINNIRVPISIARFIKMKVGDTFGFLIAHEQRHFVQIMNIIAALNGTTGKYPADLQAA